MLLRDLVEDACRGLELARSCLEAVLLLQFFALLHEHVGFHEEIAGIVLRAGGESGDAERGDEEEEEAAHRWKMEAEPT